MTNTELQTVRRAITLLRSLIDEPQEYPPLPQHSPVRRFVQEYLAPDPDADLSCEEAWQFFEEIAHEGELPPMRKAAFLRQLPIVMESIHHVRKCHGIERADRRVRGFRGVAIRLDANGG
jgi:hypothetical protein